MLLDKSSNLLPDIVTEDVEETVGSENSPSLSDLTPAIEETLGSKVDHIISEPVKNAVEVVFENVAEAASENAAEVVGEKVLEDNIALVNATHEALLPKEYMEVYKDDNDGSKSICHKDMCSIL